MPRNYILTSTAIANMTWWTAEVIQATFNNLDTKDDAANVIRIVHDQVNDTYFRCVLRANNDVYIKCISTVTPNFVNEATQYPIIEAAG